MGKISQMASRQEPLRIMLGFVVRQCAVALGHRPTAAELADWANEQRDERGRYRIFGRAITADEASVVLKHPGRLVTVRPGPRWAGAPTAGVGSDLDSDNVAPLRRAHGVLRPSKPARQTRRS
jgi:hypothetical protein